MKIISAIFLMTILFFCAIAGITRADDQSEWLKAKKVLLELPFEKSEKGYQEWCQKSWDILWPWAKKGNLEARALLLEDYNSHRRYMPGHYDWVSAKRDIIIFIIHTAGYDYQKHNNTADSLIDLLKEDHAYDSFRACRKKNSTSTCTKSAVQQGLVPTFEDYTVEIDFQLSRGNLSQCKGGMAFVGDKRVEMEKKYD